MSRIHKIKQVENRSLPVLTSEQSDYMLSNNDESITYGDNGGILAPFARLGPENMAALEPTVIPETSFGQIANVLSPQARLNNDVQSQIIEFELFGFKTNQRSVVTIALALGIIYLIKMKL